MRGLGTIFNVITVLIGGSLGLLIGSRFNKDLNKAVIGVNGFVSMVIGIQMAFTSKNILIVLISLALGVIIGEIIDIEGRLQRFSQHMEDKFGRGEEGKFAKGFLTTSILFCVGPLTILGSLQDGLTGDIKLLATKSILDGFSSIVFASAFGVGVMFTIITIIVVQGSLTLLAGTLSGILTQAVIAELTGVGGIMVISIGLGLLEIKKYKTANMLPALLIAPIIVMLLTYFKFI
ncbi:DUF554 domain-containing protein [Candidatus Gottesmanbacteria bacterium]|nr:DUF554 domain-containing protein [Candidatus Gottesmanbacteria bacterium]